MNKDLITRLIISVVTFINMLASALGFNPLELDNETIYTAVSAVAVLLAWGWGFWRNNNFTAEAKEAQEVLDMLKAGEE